MCLLLFSLNKRKSHLEINLNLQTLNTKTHQLTKGSFQIGAKQRKSDTLCEFGTRSLSCPTLNAYVRL